MQRIKYILLMILMLPFALSACSAQPTQAPPTAAPVPSLQPGRGITSEERELPVTDADVPRISLEEAQAALQSGAAVVVDVRNSGAFEASHVTGAISVPLGAIERGLADVPLDRDQWIITYCT